MLLHDPFAGHRHWETGEPLLPQSDAYWTEWDYALADAVTFIQDHTDKHGHLVWEVESDATDVVITKKIDKHDAKVEARTGGKNYKPSKGEYFVSRVVLKPGWEDEGWPTYESWAAEQRRLLGNDP